MSVKNKKNTLVCLIHDLSNKSMVIPSGAAFISSVLKQKSFIVKNYVWNLSEYNSYNIENLKEAISRFDIDIVMCSGMAYDYKVMKQIFETAKHISPSMITIQGGAFVSYSPTEAMKLLPECDFGVIGEGEITVCELMDAIENRKSIKHIKGIVYNDSHHELIFTEKRIEKPDLSTLPMPDHEGFFGDWLMEHEAFLLTSGRSCNYACTFCVKLDSKYRERPLEKFFEEADYYRHKYNIKRFEITNEFFNVEEHYLRTFCEKINNYGIPVTLMTRISPVLTLDILKKLKDSGVTVISFGLESADNNVLKSMKKGITAELMLKVLSDVKAAKIDARGNFIFGDPVENNESVQRTLEFAKAHRDLINWLRLIMIRLLPGSTIYDKAVSDGRIDPMTHIKNGCPVVNISGLSDDEYTYYNDYYFNYFFANYIETDLNVRNITFKRFKNSNNYLSEFECASCGKRHELTIDLRKTTFAHCRFFCECGEKLMLDFYHHIINKAKIIKTVRDYKTAFYGIGRVFYKCYFKCELSELQNEYFLLDGGRFKLEYTHQDNRLKILPPEAINEYSIEKVIVTISDAYDLDSIVNDLSKKYPNTEFMMWYE